MSYSFTVTLSDEDIELFIDAFNRLAADFGEPGITREEFEAQGYDLLFDAYIKRSLIAIAEDIFSDDLIDGEFGDDDLSDYYDITDTPGNGVLH